MLKIGTLVICYGFGEEQDGDPTQIGMIMEEGEWCVCEWFYMKDPYGIKKHSWDRGNQEFLLRNDTKHWLVIQPD